MNHLLNVTYLPVADLRPYPRNARTHSKKQIRQTADSIRQFGFTNPVLIEGSGMILAGHGRIEAARQLGMKEVPCVRIEGMSEAQKRAYILADNKLPLKAGWDEEILALELQVLLETPAVLDIGITGFEAQEIDVLIEGLAPEEAGDPADEVLPDAADDRVPVSRPGEVWHLGPHRLLCADAREPRSFERLMGQDRAQMVFTDPPYNVPIEGHVSGLGRTRHREFAMASGEMTPDQFVAVLKAVFLNLASYSSDGSIHFVCMDWRHAQEVMTAGETAYTELKNLCIWVKDNGGTGSFYRSRHELVFAFKAGAAPHINTFELGKHGRYRTNVWQYKGVNTLKAGRQEELALHPTVKPVALIADAIKDVSRRGGIVLDCFGGSGSTLIAAHKTGREARIMEIDPIYCDRIIRRWQVFAKDEAILAATGQSFSEVERERAGPVSGRSKGTPTIDPSPPRPHALQPQQRTAEAEGADNPKQEAA